jgi:hypothetical protein
MANRNIQWIGLKELQRAIKRNPQKVQSEARKFLVRGMAVYKSGIIRNPWRMGSSGGGSPVAAVHGGNLRDTHHTEVSGLQARIFPTASYAPYVHGIEGYPRKRTYQLRPWLIYVKNTKEGEIARLQDELLHNIVRDLAR